LNEQTQVVILVSASGRCRSVVIMSCATEWRPDSPPSWLTCTSSSSFYHQQQHGQLTIIIDPTMDSRVSHTLEQWLDLPGYTSTMTHISLHNLC